MPVRSAWLINRTDTTTGQSRTDTRLAPTGTMSPQGPLGSRDGVLPGSADGSAVMGGLYVFGDTAGMTAKVAPGRAIVQGTEPAGAYPVAVTAYTPVTFADGDPNNPRIDLVVLRIYDSVHDSSGRTEAVLEVVQGVPAGTPEVPVTPSASLALAEVTVPAAASVGTGGIDWANGVFDRRRPTVAIGGVIPQSWGDNFDGAYPGQFRDTGTHLERWDGTAWQPYARQLGGIAPAGEVATGQYVGQYRDEGGRLERWDGTVWRPATPGPAFAHHTDGGHASSTTYVDTATDTTGPTVVATFVAPVSGSALVTIGFIGFAGSASGYADISARIRQGSTMILEAVPERAARIEGTAFQTATTQFPVTGLQPGTEYTATLCYRTSSDDETGWYDNRFVRVDPML